MPKKINMMTYVTLLSHYGGTIHQSTNSKGQRQSAWVVTATYNKTTDNTATNTDNFTVHGQSIQAIDDDISCFIIPLTPTPMHSAGYAVCWIKGDGQSNKVYGNYYQHYVRYVYNKNYDPPKLIDDGTQTVRIQHNIDIKQLLRQTGGVDEDFINNLPFKYCRFYSTQFVSEEQYGMETRASTNSTPVFDNSDNIKDYIDTGDTSGAIIDYSIDWTVYLSDKKTPQIKIVWRSLALERLFNSGTESPDNVYINVYVLDYYTQNKVVIDNVTYNNSYVSTTFRALCAYANPLLLTIIDSNLPIDIPGAGGEKIDRTITFYMTLNTVSGYTSTAAVTLDYEKGYTNAYIVDSALIGNSTITVIYGTGDTDNGYQPPVNDSNVGDDTQSGNGYDGLNRLSTSYVVSDSALGELSSKLWSKSFIDQIFAANSDPLANVVSCKIIPRLVSGQMRHIILGNYDTEIDAEYITNNIKFTVGTIDIEPHYNSFLDYAPYTKLTMFLPFLGFKELDTSQFMGRTMEVEYVIDIITSSVKVLLYADNIYVQSFDGQCGIDIPLSSSNRAEVEASYVSGALGAIGELATGNVIGAVSGALSTAMTPYHYNTQGAYNPSCGAYETRLCYIIIDRPTAQYPVSYGHNVGYPCHLTRNLSTLKGFTKCGGDIDLRSCAASEAEKEMIKQALIDGVYL